MIQHIQQYTSYTALYNNTQPCTTYARLQTLYKLYTDTNIYNTILHRHTYKYTKLDKTYKDIQTIHSYTK